MSNKPLHVGLIGLGNMGKNHLRILSMLGDVHLCFIYDRDTEKARTLAAAHNTQTHDTLEACYAAHPELDAVVIAAPTSTHATHITQAADHVKHMFVEKPMAVDLAQAKQIETLATKRDLHIQVGFIERFNPAVIQLKHILDNAPRVIQLDFTRTNKLSARITDVDVVADLMIHDIDLALYLNGPVRDVTACGHAEGGLVAFASAVLTHENGCFSRIQASRITEKKMRKIEATCEDSFVDCELMRKEIMVSRQSEILQRENEAYNITSTQENIEVKPQEALLIELQAFIEGCKGNAQTLANSPDVHAAVRALDVATAIQQRIHGS